MAKQQIVTESGYKKMKDEIDIASLARKVLSFFWFRTAVDN